jgi:VWFA-related protein
MRQIIAQPVDQKDGAADYLGAGIRHQSAELRFRFAPPSLTQEIIVMHSPKVFVPGLLLTTVLYCFGALVSPAQAQNQKQKAPLSQGDEVVRVNTELVQTDVTVLDKQGQFVDGLARDQFQLSVDGKAQAISFMEAVTNQESLRNQPLTGSEGSIQVATSLPARPKTSDRGRVIFFFIDDVHVAPENLARARKALLDFIDNQMMQNDQVAIVSTSGQIGFLQQLTGSPAVLREAVARLNNRRNPETYAGKVTISEYDATQVAEHFNRELFTYLVAATVAEYQTDAATAVHIVQNRVHQIAAQSHVATTNTLGALLGLVRSSAPLPGRKIVFFITDGFVADPRATNILQMMQRVTKTAAQVGAVIYAMDARGTFSDPGIDATQNRYPDFTGSVSRNLLGESTATQEPLQTLAAETGGRAFVNSNSFQDGFTRGLNESSSYYLLAWRPERNEQRSGKSRVVVSVKGRPDLKVRVRRGFIEAPSRPAVKDPSSSGKASAAAAGPDNELWGALGSLYPLRDLPLALAVGYLGSPKGSVLVASMQIDAAVVDSLHKTLGKQPEVEVIGVAIDDRGSIASFKQKVMMERGTGAARNEFIVWNQQLLLAPGLYQVRVAVRERVSGRMGSAMQWLEVPELAGPRLKMSSLFLGERKVEDLGNTRPDGPLRSVTVNVDHRFSRGSILRFQSYIYNAERGTTAADVEMQARILRNDTTVIVMAPARLPTETTTDQLRLPYWAEIALDQLAPGRYVLQLTATDRRIKATTIQETDFYVD